MGRKRGSYKFEKRQKELKKQKKKQEKMQRRQGKGDEFDAEPVPTIEQGPFVESPAEPDTEPEPDN